MDKNKLKQRYLYSVYIIAVLWFSRVYVGVHYISDVIGGWFFASVFAGIGIQIYDFIANMVRGE